VAEERNPVTSDADDTGEIQEEIARTRSEMSQTISEIQDRLTPEHLIQQAKDSVQEAAAGKVRTIMHSANDTAGAVAGTTRRAANQASSYVSQHPVQIALMATGVTWLLTRNNHQQWEDTRGYDDVDDWQGAGAQEGYVEQAKDATRHAADQMRGVASTATRQVQQRWRRAGYTSQRWMMENPLAVGVAAVAAGVALGLAVPRTRLEDRTLGEARDSMMEKASEAARDLKDTVTEKAKDMAGEVMGGGTATTEAKPRETGSTMPGNPAGTYRPI
jgi:ElaB/YqjD/DUF883 family membrane-anchored ribosome-binding protein